MINQICEKDEDIKGGDTARVTTTIDHEKLVVNETEKNGSRRSPVNLSNKDKIAIQTMSSNNKP